MLQFLCVDGSDSEEYKEEWIKVEAMSINVSDSSDDVYVSRVAFMII